MAAHMNESKLSVRDRKLKKKLFQIKDRLTKKENIVTCDYPTSIVCVQNGGLDNGTSCADLLPVFSQCGCVVDIIMIPRKSYCFVCFDCCEAAARACQNVTGHLLKEGNDPSQNIILYVFFVAQAPSSICPSTQLPPGLVLVENFITEETEQILLQRFTFEDQDQPSPQMKHRAVQHFGFEFKYGINNVDPQDPLAEGIPDECREFLQRALDQKLVAYFPDQLTVNCYLPGQGIPPHIDTVSAFEDGIMSLSCGSKVIMEFRHPDGAHLSVLLPPRSLLVMTGESRYVWTHGITPRKSDIIAMPGGGLTLSTRGTRVSLTFRKISSTAGITEIDEKKCTMPATEKEASALEKEHVHCVYEEIAGHFSDTRHKPWPQIAEFLQEQQPGSILVDIGCGNGKYFGINTQLFEIGCDHSKQLATICWARGLQVFVSDILSIPFRTGCVDVALCIAVVHHLSTQERRRRAVEELVRILRPGGHVLIYVWAQEQEKDSCKSKYLKPNKELRKKSKEEKPEICSNNIYHDVDELLKMENQEKQQTTCLHNNSAQSVNDSDTLIEKDNYKTQDKKCLHNWSLQSETRTVCLEKKNCLEPSSEEDVQNSLEANVNSNSISDNFTNSSKIEKSNLTNLINCVECNDDNILVNNSCSEQLGNSLSKGIGLQVHVNRTEFKEQDVLVPWQLKRGDRESKTGKGEKAHTYHRYYHVFMQGELETLCEEVAQCAVTKSYYDQGNWCVVLQKL